MPAKAKRLIEHHGQARGARDPSTLVIGELGLR